MGAFQISDNLGSRDDTVLGLEQARLGRFDDMQGHLDQVIGGVVVDTARRIYEALVLDRVSVEKETLAGKARHLRSGDELLVLEDNLAELFVRGLLGGLGQGIHLFLKAATLLKQLIDVGLALLFGFFLELLTWSFLRVTLLVCLKIDIVADLLSEGGDAATWTKAAQYFEDVAICHISSLCLESFSNKQEKK